MTAALASMTGFAHAEGSTDGLAWAWELRSVNGGRSVVSFSIAENRRWADKATGATQEAVTYLDVTAWGTNGRTRRQEPALRRGRHHPGRQARPRRGRRPELSPSTTSGAVNVAAPGRGPRNG